ncbi:hypothetical protein AX768_09260 [Burkholderia sp. PAMC 28687]|uniref:tail fiber assembly protein n=1 Tax=Burkholderia sp. PAMC 28687 TaxID=1795874 RepID=UPI000782B926|nr:tail fiber assembly protein [Burkholderia sp. PAMC 28687]AMM14256.1 hypothetical protein AX768_09260 [Burkholderia sp. PAMC 28687]
MKIYARVMTNVVQEIITPATDDEGNEIPIADRFTTQLVAQMVDITGVTPEPACLWTYNGSTFSAPVVEVPTQDQIVASNAAEQLGLMSAANAATFGRADAFVAGLLDDADIAAFKGWAAYKLALSKVDLTQASPAWPASPNDV